MTELLYMKDFDVETCDARVLAVTPADEDRIDVVLDQTCFYARGGGQDWDQGQMSRLQSIFRVSEVRIDGEGTVHHLGRMEAGDFAVGDQVWCEVDSRRRQINTRLHSAAHVIDMAVAEVAPDWIPVKGQHYPDISAVEYRGTLESARVEELRSLIERRARQLVDNGSQNRMLFIPAEELGNYCRHVPKLPENKPSRVVLYGEFGIPCGGTHVRDIRDVGVVSVSKIKEKKGTVRLSYGVQGVNA